MIMKRTAIISFKTEIIVSLTSDTSSLLNYDFTNFQGMRSLQFWPQMNKRTAFVLDYLIRIDLSSSNSYFFTVNIIENLKYLTLLEFAQYYFLCTSLMHEIKTERKFVGTNYRSHFITQIQVCTCATKK